MHDAEARYTGRGRFQLECADGLKGAHPQRIGSYPDLSAARERLEYWANFYHRLAIASVRTMQNEHGQLEMFVVMGRRSKQEIARFKIVEVSATTGWRTE
jgi:hypothetical protein